MPLQETSAFLMFAYTTDPDDGVLITTTFWGHDPVEKEADVGFMFGARVIKAE